MPIGIHERNYSASIESEVYSAKLSQINLDNFSNHIKFKLNEEDSIIISSYEILKKYENVLMSKSVKIQISEDYYYRPEMVSLRMYNTTDLWFLILFLNKLDSIDKLDSPVIRVLDPNQVVTLLEIIHNEKNKTNSRSLPAQGEDLQLKKLTDKSDFIIKKVFNRYKPIKHPEYNAPVIRKIFSTTLHSSLPSDTAKTIIKKILDDNKICLPIKEISKSENTILRTELLIKDSFPNTIKPLFFGGCAILYKGVPIFEDQDNTESIINSLTKNLKIKNNKLVINEYRIIRKDLITFITFKNNYTGDVIVSIKDTSNNITEYKFFVDNSSRAFIPVIFNSGIYNDDNTGILSVEISFSSSISISKSSKYGEYTFKEVTLPVLKSTTYENIVFMYTPKVGRGFYDNIYFCNSYLSYNFKKFYPIDSTFYHALTEENTILPVYDKKVILTDLATNKSLKSDDVSISIDVSINDYNTTDCVGVFFKRKKVATNIGNIERSATNMEDDYYVYCLSVKDFRTDKIKGGLNGLYKIETASTSTYKITRPGSTLIKIDPNKDFYLVGKKLADTPQYLTGNSYNTNIRISTEGPLITIYDERNKPLIEYRDSSPITEKCVYSNTLDELKNIKGSLSYGIFEFTDKSFTEEGTNIKITNVLFNKLGYEN